MEVWKWLACYYRQQRSCVVCMLHCFDRCIHAWSYFELWSVWVQWNEFCFVSLFRLVLSEWYCWYFILIIVLLVQITSPHTHTHTQFSCAVLCCAICLTVTPNSYLQVQPLLLKRCFQTVPCLTCCFSHLSLSQANAGGKRKSQGRKYDWPQIKSPAWWKISKGETLHLQTISQRRTPLLIG